MTSEQPERSFEVGREPFEFLLWRHSEQFRAIKGSDRKSERALELGLAVAGVFTAAFALILEDSQPFTIGVALAAAAIVGAAFATTLVCFFRSYAVSRWRAGPAIPDVARAVGAYPDTEVRAWLIDEFRLRSRTTSC